MHDILFIPWGAKDKADQPLKNSADLQSKVSLQRFTDKNYCAQLELQIVKMLAFFTGNSF